MAETRVRAPVCDRLRINANFLSFIFIISKTEFNKSKLKYHILYFDNKKIIFP